MPNRRRALLSVLLFCCTFAHAQTIAFELQTHLDSPIALLNFTPGTFRTAADRRQFFTVKNESDQVTAAVVFQQEIGSGSKTEIVTLERVSIIIRPGEQKRLSVSVRDVWNRIQTAVKSAETMGKPVLSVVVVEFVDGSVWSAPLPVGGRAPAEFRRPHRHPDIASYPQAWTSPLPACLHIHGEPDILRRIYPRTP